MKILKKVLIVLIFAILIPILIVNIVIIAKSYIYPNEVPDFMGWKPFITLSGSMETEIYTGDLAIVKEVEPATLKRGDVIAFREPNDMVITHRIVDLVQEDGKTKFVTKGDNNNTKDRDTVSYDQVEGIYKFKISRLGNVAMFLQTPIGIVVALSIPILLYIVFQVLGRRKEKEYVEFKNKKEQELQAEIERLKKENEKFSK